MVACNSTAKEVLRAHTIRFHWQSQKLERHDWLWQWNRIKVFCSLCCCAGLSFSSVFYTEAPNEECVGKHLVLYCSRYHLSVFKGNCVNANAVIVELFGSFNWNTYSNGRTFSGKESFPSNLPAGSTFLIIVPDLICTKNGILSFPKQNWKALNFPILRKFKAKFYEHSSF